MEKLQGEKHCKPREMLISHLLKNTLITAKPFGMKFYGLMGQKWNFLKEMGLVKSDIKLIQHSLIASFQESNMMVVL